MSRILTGLMVLLAPLAAVAAPALKANGDRILYVSGDPGMQQIYCVKDDCTGAEKLTSGEGNHLFPMWSPDGKKIAFTIEKDVAQHVYVMDSDGKNVKQITKDGGP